MDQIKPIHIGECQIDDHGIVHSFHRKPLGLLPATAGIDAETRLRQSPG
jgi:hypothetical protein